jgi:hypothetical protein
MICEGLSFACLDCNSVLALTKKAEFLGSHGCRRGFFYFPKISPLEPQNQYFVSLSKILYKM